MNRDTLPIIDPNPCRRYRWAEEFCPDTPSGAHVCARKGGHEGQCRCYHCGQLGRGKDRADAIEAGGEE